MKIQFKKLGKIDQLGLCLRPGLTLFCGPNNTGKTYTAYGVYSVLSNLGKVRLPWLGAADLAVLLNHGSLSFSFAKANADPNFMHLVSVQLSKRLAGDFDATPDFFSDECIDLSDLDQVFLPPRPAKGEVAVGPYRFILVFDGALLWITASQQVRDGEAAVPADALLEIVNEKISVLYAESHLCAAHVLSAERAAINLFSRELSSSRSQLVNQLLALSDIGQKVDFGSILTSQAVRYSLPIRAGLDIAEDLKNIVKMHGEFADLARQLETTLLQGGLHIGEHGELMFQTGNDIHLRINLSASMVKSLASLVVYLRHQGKKGDLLIIDEPELNLHPDSQRRLARFFVELVNAGVNLIISTHSDYIIREINNAIMLSQPGLAGIKHRYGYRDSELINPERVSVVLFRADANPEPIAVDERGFAVASIDDEINQLNRIASEIMLELEP